MNMEKFTKFDNSKNKYLYSEF